jgi:feruloyl esterase
LIGGSEPNNLGTQYVQYFLLDDPEWKYQDFDYSIVELADSLQPGNATADNYDLDPFRARGGKVVHYHGSADGLIPVGSSEYFYKQVAQTMQPQGVELDEFYRYFEVPGMLHCRGSPQLVKAPW